MRRDLASVARLGVVEKILDAAGRLTGMGFAAVARVTADRWMACAVRDEIAFGLKPGDELELLSTLCHEVRGCGRTIVIDHVSEDPVYRDHHTPRRYGFQSYISTPIYVHGEFFGTLCAIDAQPARPGDPTIVATFELFAELIGRHLEADILLARSAALVALSDRFRDLEDPAELSFAAAEILGKTLWVARSGYATVDAARETALVERDWTAPGVASIAGLHHFRRYGSFIDDLKRGNAVIFADAEEDPRTAGQDGAMTRIGARAIVNLPVIEQNKLVAILYLHSAEPRRWTADELSFVREVADRTRSATERRRAERDLRLLNETLERQVSERTAERDRVWRLARDLLVVVGSDGFFRAVNPAWERILGHKPAEVIGRSFVEFVCPEDCDQTQQGLDIAAAERDLTHFENRYRHKDGTLRWISWHTSTEGDLVYAYGRDITEEKARAAALHETEEALRQSQKMESIGQLTGGVAHDFNNMLTVITGNMDMARRSIAAGDEGRTQRAITNALKGAEMASSLTRRLLAFARRQPLAPQASDVNALIGGIVEMIRRSLGEEVTLDTRLAEGLPHSRIDPNQLENAILNLAVNARDAMPTGGRLTIATSPVEIDEAGAMRLDLVPGRYVELAVADTGTGMPPEVVARVFEPFYTTKPKGSGTGLGLSMVHGFAKQSGGAIVIDTRPGEGTKVRLFFPIAEAPAIGRPQPLPTGATERRGAERILLVEDDDAVAELATEILTDAGYTVVHARSGEDGLRRLEDGLEVALVFSDIVMPGALSGVGLAHEAAARWPETRVLLTSGYSSEAVEKGHPFPIIHKPYRRGDLLERVRNILDEAPAENAPPDGAASAITGCVADE